MSVFEFERYGIFTLPEPIPIVFQCENIVDIQNLLKGGYNMADKNITIETEELNNDTVRRTRTTTEKEVNDFSRAATAQKEVRIEQLKTAITSASDELAKLMLEVAEAKEAFANEDAKKEIKITEEN